MSRTILFITIIFISHSQLWAQQSNIFYLVEIQRLGENTTEYKTSILTKRGGWFNWRHCDTVVSINNSNKNEHYENSYCSYFYPPFHFRIKNNVVQILIKDVGNGYYDVFPLTSGDTILAPNPIYLSSSSVDMGIQTVFVQKNKEGFWFKYFSGRDLIINEKKMAQIETHIHYDRHFIPRSIVIINTNPYSKLITQISTFTRCN